MNTPLAPFKRPACGTEPLQCKDHSHDRQANQLGKNLTKQPNETAAFNQPLKLNQDEITARSQVQ
ncbi:hypothetical protein H6F43_18410 [Leptolyngbya sp. FACHB-36]|uniref:hypothetical protein n=1 Tax=Leptolyngbya sp. FACHB-36 TaxID=2692808 RepID=UPI001680A395|nr:hypothetical protein [Leptolyngbya sp. FACHB-36]MBD2022156.1 hypothetical protein [Leptolyngbya sp. FACHB-36]